MSCRCAKTYNNVVPINNIPPSKYSCKIEVKKRCDQRLETIINLYEREKQKEKEEQEKEEEERKAKVPAPIVSPCAGIKIPKQKKSKTISRIAYSRPWTFEQTFDSPVNEFPKWFRRRRKQSAKFFLNPNVCPRKPDDYERSLWISLCKPPRKQVECKEVVDSRICVFCLGSLYTGGYIHELFEKTPLIKEQSTLYGDEISWRTGERTRIVVHKNCYNSYIDLWSHKKQEEKEEAKFKFDLGNEEIQESESSNCGEKNGDEELKEGEERKDGKETNPFKKNLKKSEKVEQKPRKQCFCLEKYKIPKTDSEAVDRS